MLEAGHRVCGGSDAPVEPISTLLGIHAAITRKLPEAEEIGKRELGDGYDATRSNRELESLRAFEAIQLYTTNPAYATHREHQTGIIRPGRWADLVVLDRDITDEENVDELPKTNVIQTIVGGHIAHDVTGDF